MTTRHYDNAYLDLFAHVGGRIRIGASMRPNPIVSVETSGKSLKAGKFAGSATVTLRDTAQLRAAAGGRKLIDYLRDDDWAILYSGEAGGFSDLELLALDTITEHTQVRGGGPTVTHYQLAFRDWAKVIDDTEVWFCEWGKAPNYAGANYFDLLQQYSGPPDQVCKKLVDGFLSPRAGDAGVWQLPPGLAWEFGALESVALERIAEPVGVAQIMDTSFYVAKARGAGFQASPPGSSFGLASLLREWSNPIMNELFFDVRAGGDGRVLPCMIMREQPFPAYLEDSWNAWGQLPVVTVPRSAVLSSSLSIGGAERFNVFSLMPDNEVLSQMEQKGMYPPTYAPGSVKRHGIKSYEVGTRYVSMLRGDDPEELPDGQPVDEPRRWMWLLHSWHGIGAELKSGSIELRGAWPNIRIGRRLTVGRGPTPQHDPERLNVYIEGVSRVWDPGDGWRTTVDAVRGYNGDDSVVRRLIGLHFSDLQSSVAEETAEIGGAVRATSWAPPALVPQAGGFSAAAPLGLIPTQTVVPRGRDVLAGPGGATLAGRKVSS